MSSNPNAFNETDPAPAGFWAFYQQFGNTPTGMDDSDTGGVGVGANIWYQTDDDTTPPSALQQKVIAEAAAPILAQNRVDPHASLVSLQNDSSYEIRGPYSEVSEADEALQVVTSSTKTPGSTFYDEDTDLWYFYFLAT